MFKIYFLNLFNEVMIEQTRNLEKLIDFKMYLGVNTKILRRWKIRSDGRSGKNGCCYMFMGRL